MMVMYAWAVATLLKCKLCMKLTMNIPIMLTVARIILVPFLVLAIVRHQFSVAMILLIAAAITDLFDGASARFFKQETKLGAYLDPVADKILVVACYGALLSIHSVYFTIPVWFITLVVVREVTILLGAWYWGLKKHQLPIAPTYLGKLTTALQLFLIGFLLVSSLFELALPQLLKLLLFIVSVCVVTSLVQYGYKVIKKGSV